MTSIAQSEPPVMGAVPAEQAAATAVSPVDTNNSAEPKTDLLAVKPSETAKKDTTGNDTTGNATPVEAKSPASPIYTGLTAATSTTAPTSPSPTTTCNDANSTKTTSTAAPTAVAKDDEVNPLDFAGEVQTNNDLPTQETLRKLENHTVLDADNRSVPFKSLYMGHNVARRVLIIFVRHFFCGSCQEYIRTLKKSITPEALLRLPVPTFIAVVGCSAPELIETYVNETDCPFPVYADPTRRLYNELGMVRTLALGARPAYMQNISIGHSIASSVVQCLKQVKSGLVLKMGDSRQVGGEFLFEPASMALETPITTPDDEGKQFDPDSGTNMHQNEKSEEKKVTWCHRMRSTRDHVEIPELMEVLGLDGKGQPFQDSKRWEKALRTRKGTGLSMASQMSRLSIDREAKIMGNGNGFRFEA